MEISLAQAMGILAAVHVAVYVLVGFLFQLELLHIAQLKEYKLYRIKDFLRSKKGKQQLLFHPFVIISVIAVFIQISLDNNIFRLYMLVLLVFWIIRFVQRKIYRPIFTKKAILLTILAFVGQFFSGMFIAVVLFNYVPANWRELSFAILLYALFHPLWVLFWTQLFQIPTYIAKRYYIARATKAITTYKHLTVIGITGSYGKTSTRNYLVQILSTKHQVVTTPKNINTEIGVSKFILGHDFTQDDIFVVEMGAYRKGEIKLIADMVKPQIGIITTIGPEHLALFGSMENIRDTKGELFASLPKGGLAITNADSKYCSSYAETYKHVNIQTFGTTELQHPSLLISNVAQTKDGIDATFNYEGKDVVISAPLYGTHNAANIAAALLAAQEVGMDVTDMVQATKTLFAPPHRLNRVKIDNNVVVLDDTYNSNPEGFLEALDILAIQEQPNKIVITRGMLELGIKEAEEHQRIGKRIGEVATTIVIISPDNAAHIQTGIEKSGGNTEIITDFDMASVADRYYAIIEGGNVAILLENRVPNAILKTV